MSCGDEDSLPLRKLESSVKRKKCENKSRFSEKQVKLLESIFEAETKIEPLKKVQLAMELGLEPRQVAIWFQNRRARWKSKQLEKEYSVLKGNYENLASQVASLKEENHILYSQVQSLSLALEKPEQGQAGVNLDEKYLKLAEMDENGCGGNMNCASIDELGGSSQASTDQEWCGTDATHNQSRAEQSRAMATALLSTPPSFNSLKLPRFWPWEKVRMGPLSVSPMGLGTWAWGNQLLWGYDEKMDSELQRVFDLVVDNGINLFDTADSYGTGRFNGRSEKLLGKFIREFPGRKEKRDELVIATKFAAYPWRLTPRQFVKACEQSLERMEIEQIGIGQLHWSTANYAPLQERALWDGLVAMYDKGLVRAVGVSNYGPNQLLKIHEYLKVRGVPLCSAQVQYSLVSMGESQTEMKRVCDSLGIRVISYSPLGLGMLTGKYTPSNLPSGPRAILFSQILPGLEPLLEALTKIAQRRRKTIPQVAINWCICKGTIPIPGVRTVKQAEENLGALGWRLSTEEILVLENAAMESPRKMIQNVFQTK
ncbi:unnamed protein product [Rhodiola kirilowii]